MTQIKVDATGETLDVSDDQLGVLAARGGFSFPAGTQIPVRAADGSVSAVPVEQYWANQGQLNTASPEDIAKHQALMGEQQAQAHEAALDEQYGNSIGNFARAHAESTTAGITQGLSDWLLTSLGADPTGLKERRERNAYTGASEMAGMVIPALLTGGESAVAEGAMGVAARLASATPAALVERVGEAIGAKVAASAGEGFMSRLAGGTARLAAEGALSGVGGEVSARAMDGKAVLDPGAMDEYLLAAGQGALIGGAMGGAGVAGAAGLGKLAGYGKAGAKKLGGYLGEMQGGAVREAEAGLATAAGEGDAILANAKAVDHDINVRAAEQRLNSLTADEGEVSKLTTLKEQARAKLAGNAPTTEVLSGAGGLPAHAPLEEISAAGTPYVYHAAPADVVGRIQKEGLNPGHGADVFEREHTFFSSTPDQAAEWNSRVGQMGQGQGVTLRTVRTPEMAAHPDRADWALDKKGVAPKNLEYWDAQQGAWKPLKQFPAAAEHEPLTYHTDKRAFAKAGAAVKNEAQGLGVSKQIADDAWARIEKGHQEFQNLDNTHATTTKKVAGIVDEMEALRQDIDDTVGMARRNDSVREALATDRTAANPEQFQQAMQMQHMRTKSVVGSFMADDESKVRSAAKKLDEYLGRQEADLAKLDLTDAAQRADALEILDQSNRVVGRYRDMMGEQVGVTGVKSFPDALSGLYEENRQILKNPEIVGQKVSEIVGKQKGNWSNVLDTSRGYKQALLRTEAGGKRSISGFESAARGDTAKIAPLLKAIDDPANQLNLELIGRGIDSRAQLMQGFLDDLKLTGKSAEQVSRYRELSKQLADEIVGWRSRQALAKEFAANALPGLKEVEGLDVKIAAAQEKSAEKLAGQRAKIQETIDSERVKADALRAKGLEKAAAQKDALVEKAQAKLDAVKDRSAEGTAAGIVESMGPVLGLVFGGGGAAGYLGGQLAGKMLTPVVRSIARNGLAGMLKAQEKAGQYAAVHAIGSRISKAAAGVVDRMHSARPYAQAAKTIALRAPRDTREEFDRTMAWVDKAGAYDARAAYLRGIAPPSIQPTQLRPDLDTTPTVHPLAMRKFLRAARAAQDPAGAIEDLAKGVQSKEATDALTILYPTLKKQAAKQIMDGAAQMKVKPSMRSQQELSLFFGTPVHFTMKPEFVASVQGTYQQANASGQGNQDMLEEQGTKTARQYNSKAGQMQATQTQRLEAGI